MPNALAPAGDPPDFPAGPAETGRRRLAVAPMLDWTDRHYRYFARLISRHTWLYTEMLTTGALLHGERERLLHFDAAESPVALQLGGSEPEDLAACARMAAERGYDEVNLNVGCPSERVRSGAFGACLMAEPELVADCLKAMQDAVGIPVTVKHRIGIDQMDGYGHLRDFVGELVRRSGCRVFIVHARNAILKGLSPKQNREIPPLRYPYVYRLKQDFPELEIVINGGLTDWPAIETQLRQVDGVMIGREAYHNPWLLAEADRRVFGDPHPLPTRTEVLARMLPFVEREVAAGVPLKRITRHLLGLYQGLPGARSWRRMLSDPAELSNNDPSLLLYAAERTERQIARAA